MIASILITKKLPNVTREYPPCCKGISRYGTFFLRL